MNPSGVEEAAQVDDFQPEVKSRLRKLIAARPGLAVFDADHTLWNHDVGEGFYRWLLQRRLLKTVDYSRDAFAAYRAMEARDKVRAYTMLVDQMEGLSESTLASWAREYVKEEVPATVYPGMRRLLELLSESHWDVWIVSASNRWSVEAGAAYLGVRPDRVVGVDLVCNGDVLTGTLAYPLTYGPGKVAAITAKIGRVPDLVAGDSAGDLDMLKVARAGALLVEYPGDPTQAPVRAVASSFGWLRQSWVDRQDRHAP